MSTVSDDWNVEPTVHFKPVVGQKFGHFRCRIIRGRFRTGDRGSVRWEGIAEKTSEIRRIKVQLATAAHMLTDEELHGSHRPGRLRGKLQAVAGLVNVFRTVLEAVHRPVSIGV